MMTNILCNIEKVMSMTMVMVTFVRRYQGAGPSQTALSATQMAVPAGEVFYVVFVFWCFIAITFIFIGIVMIQEVVLC